MLTVERAEALTDFLKSDINRAEELLAKEPEEALKAINDSGYDFNIDELNEYCSEFKEIVAKGELDETQLEDVSGGAVITITAATIWGLAACFGGGAAIGIAAGAKW